MWFYLTIIWSLLRVRLNQIADRREDGYSTETVLVTALLTGLALLVVGTIIWNAVVDKANSIDLG